MAGDKRLTKATAPAGIYCRVFDAGDNDGLSDPIANVYEVLMKTNDSWFYLDAELDGWEGLNPLYDPFKEGQGLMRIMGPGLVGVMNVEVIE